MFELEDLHVWVQRLRGLLPARLIELGLLRFELSLPLRGHAGAH